MYSTRHSTPEQNKNKQTNKMATASLTTSIRFAEHQIKKTNRNNNNNKTKRPFLKANIKSPPRWRSAFIRLAGDEGGCERAITRVLYFLFFVWISVSKQGLERADVVSERLSNRVISSRAETTETMASTHWGWGESAAFRPIELLG